jgi:hypothetical protein
MCGGYEYASSHPFFTHQQHSAEKDGSRRTLSVAHYPAAVSELQHATSSPEFAGNVDTTFQPPGTDTGESFCGTLSISCDFVVYQRVISRRIDLFLSDDVPEK